jgi:hypothetical protein
MCGIDSIAMCLERRTGRIECLGRPSQVTRDERDFGFGNDTPRARHGFPRTEGTRRAAQQNFCSSQIPQLRHGDASQRQRGRILAQSDTLECTEWIAVCERSRCGRD